MYPHQDALVTTATLARLRTMKEASAHGNKYAGYVRSVYAS
jgi:hypothetical protein